MQTKLVWQPGVAWALGGPHLRQTPRHIRATPNHLTWATNATVPLLVQRSIQPPVRDNPSTSHKDTETNGILPQHTFNVKP